jgi:hypothetical protein
VLPNVAELYKVKIQRLHEALNQPDVCEDAGAALRSLIARIVITPNSSTGLDIDLHGELSHSSKGKTPAQVNNGVGRFALVAGARNHLNLLSQAAA